MPKGLKHQDEYSLTASQHPRRVPNKFPRLNSQSLRSEKRGALLNSSSDSIKVRIRGKNNAIETRNGSVSRTLKQLGKEEVRAREFQKTSERLRVLEQIERFREERMAKELLMYELERQKEQEEVSKQRNTERKRI